MKKILFVTYDFPFPTDSGGKTRAFNLIKFAHKDTKITLFSFVRTEPDDRDREELKRIDVSNQHIAKRNSKKDLKSILGVFTKSSIFKNLYFDPKIEKKIIEIVKEEKIDIVHFESYYTGFYITDTLMRENVKTVLGTENIEHQLYDLYTEKNAPFLTKPVLRREVRKIQSEEDYMIKKADAVVAVTQSEQKYVSDHGAKKSMVIENGVDIEYFKNTVHKEKSDILFIGNFSYFPNIDAARYLYTEILPHLPKEIKVKIVGKNYTKLGIRDERVSFIDYIDDIRDAYSTALVFVSPIRIGGGTNFKVLEAMATRTPIVADPSRVKDLGATPGRDILIARDGREFAEKIQELYESRKLQEQIAQNALEFVSTNYSWKNIGGKLNNLWQTL